MKNEKFPNPGSEYEERLLIQALTDGKINESEKFNAIDKDGNLARVGLNYIQPTRIIEKKEEGHELSIPVAKDSIDERLFMLVESKYSDFLPVLKKIDLRSPEVESESEGTIFDIGILGTGTQVEERREKIRQTILKIFESKIFFILKMDEPHICLPIAEDLEKKNILPDGIKDRIYLKYLLSEKDRLQRISNSQNNERLYNIVKEINRLEEEGVKKIREDEEQSLLEIVIKNAITEVWGPQKS